MVNVRPLLLLALIFAAAADAMATTPMSDGTLPAVPDALDLPPLPAPADMPAVPPCLQELAVCASVYQDSSKLAPCCSSVKKVFKSDKACICSALGEAQKALEQLKQQPGMNATALDGLEMFRQCGIPTDSCDPVKPAGSQNVGNAAPGARSIGRFDIMLLLPLFFVL